MGDFEVLPDAGVEMGKVQDLLGHRHITTTQIYDKRRRSTSESDRMAWCSNKSPTRD
jgi:integrase